MPASTATSAGSGSNATVEVYKSAGGRQCEPECGTSIETMEADLAARRIAVKSRACGAMAGVQFIAACGAYDGSINVYMIRKTDLERARQLGFERTADLPPDGDGRTWRRTRCP